MSCIRCRRKEQELTLLALVSSVLLASLDDTEPGLSLILDAISAIEEAVNGAISQRHPGASRHLTSSSVCDLAVDALLPHSFLLELLKEDPGER